MWISLRTQTAVNRVEEVLEIERLGESQNALCLEPRGVVLLCPRIPGAEDNGHACRPRVTTQHLEQCRISLPCPWPAVDEDEVSLSGTERIKCSLSTWDGH